jgi:DNA invertase Pin-like site-specific DNA recombinase
MSMTKAIGYLRVSTSEQVDSGAGIEAQRSAILAEAQRRGWSEVTFVEDLGYSGKDLNRPGVQAALAALKGHRADALVVAKLDRLSRSLLDFAGLMQVSTRERWALVALDLGVDTTTLSGRAMAQVMATFAELERGMIGQRTKDALAARRAAGVRLGRPPVMEAAVIDRMRVLRDGGASYQSIADALNASQVPTSRGGACWYASTVRSALKRS